MRLPVEVAACVRDARSAKKPHKPIRLIDGAFRVPRQDFDKWLTVPSVDEEIAVLLKDFKDLKLTAYAPFWEGELRHVDQYMKWFMRVSSFQMAILNAIIIDLQPMDDQPQEHTFALPATQLVTDMTAQLLKHAGALSHHVTKTRRNHAAVGFKSQMCDSLMKELLKASYEGDATLLFGGKFTKSRKHARKIEEEKKATDASTSRGGYSGYRGGKGGGRAPQRASFTDTYTTPATPARGRGRGVKRPYNNQQQPARGRGQAARGPAAKRARGPSRGGRRSGGRGAKRF
jgi:hypothetical protein